MADDFPTVGDNDNGGVWPFVYFKLYEFDTGSLIDRVKTSQFILRNPSCVRELTKEGATIEVSNAGQVASDLILVEWRVVFCTLKDHLPHEGFSVSHFAETQSDPADDLENIDFIAANSFKTISVNFPEAPSNLQNIYFQARVSLLWDPDVPMAEWDFATDIRVTEAHRKA